MPIRNVLATYRQEQHETSHSNFSQRRVRFDFISTSIYFIAPPFLGRSSARHAKKFATHRMVLDLIFGVNTAMRQSHVLTAAQEYSSLSIISINTSETNILSTRNLTAAVSALASLTIQVIATNTRDAANSNHRRLRPSLCCVTSRLQLRMRVS